MTTVKNRSIPTERFSNHDPMTLGAWELTRSFEGFLTRNYFGPGVGAYPDEIREFFRRRRRRLQNIGVNILRMFRRMYIEDYLVIKIMYLGILDTKII